MILLAGYFLKFLLNNFTINNLNKFEFNLPVKFIKTIFAYEQYILIKPKVIFKKSKFLLS